MHRLACVPALPFSDKAHLPHRVWLVRRRFATGAAAATPNNACSQINETSLDLELLNLLCDHIRIGIVRHQLTARGLAREHRQCGNTAECGAARSHSAFSDPVHSQHYLLPGIHSNKRSQPTPPLQKIIQSKLTQS